MDPKAGMLRLVLGLGTRAVDRVEGDYPRIVALDEPMKLPLKGYEDIRRFSQKDVDLVNINDNALQSLPLFRLSEEGIDLNLERYGGTRPGNHAIACANAASRRRKSGC